MTAQRLVEGQDDLHVRRGGPHRPSKPTELRDEIRAVVESPVEDGDRARGTHQGLDLVMGLGRDPR